ncbi:membrane protein [Nocardioides flavus (ex Wang et al. 2016)]|uniref:Membrane protein n=1 Tax=Nocardioides flavus (ex Wang et al. 2016) TaxID=2058780 RepID=A0ABQ3HIA7_9ACTN|nr:organomercurial lyase [Nocardioides flavus (ex Wang et al. 2016)]GHE15506.1 membrane protein [Nocardioides flavus (ex Wang et al. 2016)]
MDSEDVRIAVYDRFRRGEVPSVADLAADLSSSRDEVGVELKALAEQRHLALDADGEVAMAHPFTAVPLGFSVMGRDALWWGGCAWDSFALPHLLPEQSPVLVATSCPACDTPHAWHVDDREPPPGDQVAHFLVPTRHMWDDVVHTCGNQRIFCSEQCVTDWLARTGNQRGYVMNLPTLWRLASGWYAGRLERGYVRREPSAAADYLRGVGLSGPFWGLTD